MSTVACCVLLAVTTPMGVPFTLTVMASISWFVTTTVTGTVTVTVALPDLPSDVAVIVTAPALTPVTRPLAFTVAPPPLLPQVTVRPANTFPPASRVVAVNWTVWETLTVVGEGLIVTLATATGPVLLPPQAAATNGRSNQKRLMENLQRTNRTRKP